MSAMADLDTTLTGLKLSEAQKQCVADILFDGTTTARKTTITALENKLFIHNKGDGTYELMNALKEALGAPVPVQEIESELNTNMWDGPMITDEEVDMFKEMAEKLSGVEDEDITPDTFNKDWAIWERELCGFEATIGWKNTDVWHGLTAQEIREDMDTALPIGRKARRERARLARKVLAAV